MKYKYQYKFTRQSLPVYLIVAAAILVAISSFFWSEGILVPLLCCGVAGYITWTVAKTLAKMIASNVNTYDTGFTVTLPTGEKKQFEWTEITHAGKIITGKHAGAVFCYNEDIDTFTQLTPVFSDFETLEAELKEHLNCFSDYHLEPEQTISEYLHDLLVPVDEEEADDGTKPEKVQKTVVTEDDDDRIPNTDVDDDDEREPNTDLTDED
ncbi:MAG: hypothetical protein MJ178_10140 [Treponemataceae bacterium]|nr:hypothetical protein [Treponemataceae bacterium]